MKSVSLLILAMLLAPLYSAIILKVKAFFGGRKGPPLLINYFTLIKLLKKGSVYSTSTTWIFKMGPLVSLCAAATVLMFLPIAGQEPLFSFHGDQLVLSTKAANVGESRIEMAIEPVEVQTDGLEINFNPGYLLDLAKAIPAEKIKGRFRDQKTAGIFALDEEGFSYRHIVMPLVTQD